VADSAEKTVRDIRRARGGSGKRDHFVAIGHSFGAGMLFAAVNAPLVIDVERSYPRQDTHTYRMVRGPADAVLLLNPAFEAARYTALNSFLRNEEASGAQERLECIDHAPVRETPSFDGCSMLFGERICSDRGAGTIDAPFDPQGGFNLLPISLVSSACTEMVDSTGT
jgi:hypothetical protein